MLGQRISISKWFGRFGNNVLQLANACSYAITNNCYFESPTHEFIKSFTINKDIRYTTILEDTFFYNFNSYDQRHFYINQYISPNIINIPYHEMISSDTIVIHIRSGDIFNHNPHPKYIQNPLSYFEKIVNQYNDAIILCEDFRNPVIDILKKNSKTHIVCGPLNKTLSLMLAAQNICFSGYGTFGPVCAMLSTNVKQIHMTNIVNINNEWIFNDKINIIYDYINLDNYIQPNSWKNTNDQRQLILEYKHE